MKSLALRLLARRKYTADVTLPGHSDEVKVPCQHALQSSKCEALIVENVLITHDYIASSHPYVRCKRRFVLLPRFVGLGH